MGGETSLAGITSCASQNRQSLQDWFRVAPVTPGIHLRWLPGARVEFPYRERTMGVVLGTGGLGSMGVVMCPCRGRFRVTRNARCRSLEEAGTV